MTTLSIAILIVAFALTFYVVQKNKNPKFARAAFWFACGLVVGQLLDMLADFLKSTN